MFSLKIYAVSVIFYKTAISKKSSFFAIKYYA